MVDKVLIVEDNVLNLRLFSDLLRVHGYETAEVRDGREALDRAREFKPGVILMDIQMPHVSGLDLIRDIRADVALKSMPIIAVTAYAGKGDEERVRAAGADAYIAKPIAFGRFLETVKSVAGGQSSDGPAKPSEPDS